jgi:hypothetical protein
VLASNHFRLATIACLLALAAPVSGQQQLIDRQRVIDAINAVPTVPPPPPPPACMNGLDDDGDGHVDLLDPGCERNPQKASEIDVVAPACAFTLVQSSASVDASASSGSVALTVGPSGCAQASWTVASSQPSWLAGSPASGSGSGQVSYTVAANQTTTARTGALSVADKTFTVNQAGLPPPPPPGGQGTTVRYPLEVLNLKPAGTGGFTASHRIYWAYPGLPYEVRAAVIGGSSPYASFELSGAPEGMTVDPRGVIRWPSPSGTSATPTLMVRDAAGTTVSATWTVNVSSSRFRFVDAATGNDANAGTQSAPWRTFAKVYTSSTGAQIVYFRQGTYTLDGIPTLAANNAQGEEYIAWDGVTKSPIWLGYPGDAQPTLDFAYTGNGNYADGTSQPRLKINGPNLYFDDMRFYRCMTMCFQVNHGNQAGTTFWRNTFDTGGPGIDGGNSALIMFVASQGNNSLYTVVQDNEFKNLRNGSANSGMKLYTLTKPLFEDNDFHDFDAASEGLAIKAAIVQYTVRGNTFDEVGNGIGGNMNRYSTADTTRGEILFNTVRALKTGGYAALHFNQNSAAGETFIERNTFIGGVSALNVDSADGPFRLHRNIIVNSDSGTPSGSHVTHVDAVTAPTRIVLTEQLAGFPADGILDAAGKLQGAFRTQWLGLRGAER